MRQHLNTLFVTTPGAWLKKIGHSVAVRVENQVRLRVPIHNIGGIVTFGAVGASPALLAACAECDVAVTFLSRTGKFQARVSGFTSGNVLLRREQYRCADDEQQSINVARPVLLAKIANARTTLLRAARDASDSANADTCKTAATRIKQSLDDIQSANSLDTLRGLEGDAAKSYFDAFNAMIVAQSDDFHMNGRTRRPPLDRVNALLSFIYAILSHDVRSACECAGLDPAVGFLHRDRPGRPGLALDLMEEFRPYFADRLVLTLINRREVAAKDFIVGDTGAVSMDDDGRKRILVAYQKRKQDEIVHPFINEKTTVGLLWHLQARLLARYLRGDLDGYPAFIAK